MILNDIQPKLKPKTHEKKGTICVLLRCDVTLKIETKLSPDLGGGSVGLHLQLLQPIVQI